MFRANIFFNFILICLLFSACSNGKKVAEGSDTLTEVNRPNPKIDETGLDNFIDNQAS